MSSLHVCLPPVDNPEAPITPNFLPGLDMRSDLIEKTTSRLIKEAIDKKLNELLQ